MSAIERLAAKLHAIYQDEARRQGDVRHADAYEVLPENIKEFDRVLARFVLEREKAAEAEVERLREALQAIVDCDYRGNKPREIAIAQKALGETEAE